jgi:drug/metabolite transporter (DMT)-like permease
VGHGWSADRGVTAAYHPTLGHKAKGARAGPSDVLPIAVIGGSNLAADMAIAYAFSGGHLGVVSVLASLGPVLTVALARLHDGERATARQGIGALLTLSGVFLTSYMNADGATR